MVRYVSHEHATWASYERELVAADLADEALELREPPPWLHQTWTPEMVAGAYTEADAGLCEATDCDRIGEPLYLDEQSPDPIQRREPFVFCAHHVCECVDCGGREALLSDLDGNQICVECAGNRGIFETEKRAA